MSVSSGGLPAAGTTTTRTPKQHLRDATQVSDTDGAHEKQTHG